MGGIHGMGKGGLRCGCNGHPSPNLCERQCERTEHTSLVGRLAVCGIHALPRWVRPMRLTRLFLAPLLALLVACGGDNADQPTVTSTPALSNTPTEPAKPTEPAAPPA